MRLDCSLIPDEIRKEYNLKNIVQDNAIYVEITKGMNGLPPSGKISNDELTAHSFFLLHTL